MLASIPVSMVNQKIPDLGIPNRINLNPSRFSLEQAATPRERIMTLARALSHRIETGKAYGLITTKFLAVLDALLWSFHNAETGRCFPSYERIAERAGCAHTTVYEAIHALERVGIRVGSTASVGQERARSSTCSAARCGVCGYSEHPSLCPARTCFPPW
jgi:Helix-turn-helix domain